MASIVIVTRACYLLCESINHISVNEASEECKKEDDWSNSRRRKKKKPKLTKAEIAKNIQNAPYRIVIDFVPVAKNHPNMLSSNKHSSDDNTSVSITVHGRDRCLELFTEMVEQIREQLPDQIFLDKIVEKLLLEDNEKDKP